MVFDPRKTRRTDVRTIRPDSKKPRIRIPQPEIRPIRVQGDVIRKSLLKEDPQWFVLHKRGVRRPWVGEDPLEARAVSRAKVIGFLHERIVYRWLTVAGFRPGVDFDFQSSQEGGRVELGGMVVDFLFPYMRIALSVSGPGHQLLIRQRKDEEQRAMLENMGYQPLEVDTRVVEDTFAFEEFMRAVFVDRSIVIYLEDDIENFDDPEGQSMYFDIIEGLNSVDKYLEDVGAN